MNRLEMVEKCPSHRGKKELVTHLSGGKISATQAIRAKCYECCGYYVDGAQDCGMPDCPLYPFNKFGEVFKNRPKKKRNVSKEVIERMAEARKKTRGDEQ
jgi:hypothetical protein